MTAIVLRVPGSRGIRFAGLLAALTCLVILPLRAAEPETVKIAVFEFELDDRSASDGVVEADAADAEYLKAATETARGLLADSGRYSIVDAAGATDALASAGGVRHCSGCESRLAAELGADRSMAGIVTRITRTEYTLQIVVRNARTGMLLSNDFTGLRMGANYSWPRGVKSLMTKGILSAAAPR